LKHLKQPRDKLKQRVTNETFHMTNETFHVTNETLAKRYVILQSLRSSDFVSKGILLIAALFESAFSRQSCQR
jgi:hypothetical protein